jgi:hypothetical protein
VGRLGVSLQDMKHLDHDLIENSHLCFCEKYPAGSVALVNTRDGRVYCRTRARVFHVGRISSTVGYGLRAMESAPAARLVLG